ncbi:transferrin-binding protein-like solute binding protein [Novosphingobium aerophilum]
MNFCGDRRSAPRGALRMAFFVPVAFSLSACGGGGSGGGVNSTPAPAPTPTPTPTPTAFTNWQTTPSNGVLRLSGSTVEAPYTPSAVFPNAVGSYGTPSVGNATADFTYSSGTPSGVSVSGALSSVNFTTSDGSTKVNLASSPSTIKYSSPSGATTLLINNASVSGYSYMSFGAWAGSTSTAGYINSFHAGSATPAASVPTSGSATYSGTSAGYYSSQSGTVNPVTSDVTLTANFSTRSIIYVASNTQGTVSYPGLNVTGTLSYASGSRTFSGTLTTPQGYGTGMLTGTASGSFYGPLGQEVAGAFVLNWSSGTVAQYVGSFGAKRP